MKVDFKKYKDGLVPAVIQDYITQRVLMLGFMNEEALKKNGRDRARHFLQSYKKKIVDQGRGEPESSAVEANADRLR